MNRNSLKTPTGRRQTSWLFTKRAGVEFGATEDKSIQWQGGGLEPGTSGLQVQRPNHQATLAARYDRICGEVSSAEAMDSSGGNYQGQGRGFTTGRLHEETRFHQSGLIGRTRERF